MVLITRKRLPIEMWNFHNYEITVRVYSLVLLAAQVGLPREKVEREAHKNWACSRRMREWTRYERACGNTRNREAPRDANRARSRRRT